MKIYAILFTAVVALAQKPTYEVKELSKEQLEVLKAAHEFEEKATIWVAEANAALKRAQDKSKSAEASVFSMAGVAPFEGPCITPSQPTQGNTVLTVMPISTKHVKTVKVLGKYALVTEEDQECGNYGWITSVAGTGPVVK